MNQNFQEPKEFKTFIRINTDLVEMVAKIKAWVHYATPNLVVIHNYGYDATVESSALRAIKLFGELGVRLLIQNHTTIESAPGRDVVAAQAVGVKLKC